MRAWALRVGQELMRALPAEHHQAIADAIMCACSGQEEGPLPELPAGEP